MSASDSEGLVQRNGSDQAADQEFEDKPIFCLDCSESFVWTVGEQIFFRDKDLLNPPKRCKECKRAKNRRLAAIEVGQLTGKRQRFEVQAECAKCSEITTVPFYPSQGRPVYCRACFIEMRSTLSNGAGTGLYPPT